jgi:hypothetical protein
MTAAAAVVELAPREASDLPSAAPPTSAATSAPPMSTTNPPRLPRLGGLLCIDTGGGVDGIDGGVSTVRPEVLPAALACSMGIGIASIGLGGGALSGGGGALSGGGGATLGVLPIVSASFASSLSSRRMLSRVDIRSSSSPCKGTIAVPLAGV